MDVFPPEIWLQIIQGTLGQPRYRSAYRLEAGASHTLTVISRVCKTLAAFVEPALYSRAVVTEESLELFARTMVRPSDPGYNFRKKLLIKSLAVVIPGQATDLQIVRVANVLLALRGTLSRLFLDITLKWTLNTACKSMTNAFKHLESAVRNLPHLEELCTTHITPYEIKEWSHYPDNGLKPRRLTGPTMTNLKRLVICDTDTHLADMILELKALDSCIMVCPRPASRDVCMLVKRGRLQGLLRPGAHPNLKDFVLAVTLETQSSSISHHVTEWLHQIMDKPDMLGSAGARRDILKVMELKGWPSENFRNSPQLLARMRVCFTETVSDGSIWSRDSLTWDEYSLLLLCVQDGKSGP